MHELLWSMFDKTWSYMWLEHKACICFWWGLVGKQIEMLRARLKPGHKWPWNHSRELGLHWVIGVESSNVSQKQKNKWTWIPRLFSNILLDFAFVSISVSKSSSRSEPNSCSSYPLYSSCGVPHLIYGRYYLQQSIKLETLGSSSLPLYLLLHRQQDSIWQWLFMWPGTLVRLLLSTFNSTLLSSLVLLTYTSYSSIHQH